MLFAALTISLATVLAPWLADPTSDDRAVPRTSPAVDDLSVAAITTASSASAASAAHVGSLADPTTLGRGLRLVSGPTDRNGCPTLVVRRWGRVLRVIPSRAPACATSRRQVRIGHWVYFDWTATWQERGRQVRRTELWATDGTRAGTRRLVVRRAGPTSGHRMCATRWAPAGGNAIAMARWCWEPGSRRPAGGRVTILIHGRLVRYLPIPRMGVDLRMAARRIVTTGADHRGRELWVHDRTMRPVDIRPGPRGSNPRWFRDLGARVTFTADDGSGRARWITDGTIAGTHRLRR